MEKRVLHMADERETRRFGMELARNAKPGTLIALTGELGVGKTALAKAVAAGLGVSETVTSPTFTILREYESGRLPFYHFDAYRVNEASEMYELGYEDYFFGNGVTLVEWADRVEALLPDDALAIRLEYDPERGETARLLRVECGRGVASER